MDKIILLMLFSNGLNFFKDYSEATKVIVPVIQILLSLIGIYMLFKRRKKK